VNIPTVPQQNSLSFQGKGVEKPGTVPISINVCARIQGGRTNRRTGLAGTPALTDGTISINTNSPDTSYKCIANLTSLAAYQFGLCITGADQLFLAPSIQTGGSITSQAHPPNTAYIGECCGCITVTPNNTGDICITVNQEDDS
jgi:hypothetical protein|tara:strand:- start:269 stop:700 length:432 start_codon:yes stop_codon:yes gene_type:complete